jgi:hypothetical protein
MTTTVTPDSRQVEAESREWPTLDLDPTHATHVEPDARFFDPTQGRKIGSDPYDDPTPGAQARLRPYDDPTRAR